MPRKTEDADEVLDDLDGASMRPRPDAAENSKAATGAVCNGTLQ